MFFLCDSRHRASAGGRHRRVVRESAHRSTAESAGRMPVGIPAGVVTPTMQHIKHQPGRYHHGEDPALRGRSAVPRSRTLRLATEGTCPGIPRVW